MVYEVIGITVLWIFLFGYIIVASIDFGAGFFSLHAKLFGQSHEINDLIQRYLNPVWEVTNVFFVFFFVGIVGFFPDTAYYYGTVLLIPGSIALILLSIRGAFYAFENYGQDSKLSWLMLYAVSGLLIPASLSTALTISEGGYITESSSGNVDLNWTELLLSPFGWAVVLLAIVSVLYISSGFLTFYAHRAKDTSAYQLMRKWFLMWGAPMIMMSLFVFLSLRIQNEAHFMSAVFDYGWLFIISFIAFAIAGVLTLLKKAHGIAFIFVIIQMGTAFFGYGLSKLPYILYPYVHIDDAVTNDSMALVLTIAFIGGLLLLLPSLFFILKLFVFDKDYVRGKK
ncbi:cytochrome d ubiquinol oxidase subunit II [Staphylococcus pseudintermedius]|uniref:Cytochrome D Ubiquinol oxidase subunit II n=4 Tax=Staphylococcus pseudintermedius TaxID=283734 RepID=A0A2P5JBJ9_STAPS|nr:cytochrome d ubiquinol oxidase subunit II [Staphylococcus pseudintermedius]ADX76962.1 cytochrome d ubiquinol oxidase, subunit II [Staphylococcus pseudintermedius ED99]ANQ82202.1 cytochrome D ubiquinol oxidase subunit II [Staphylococcus pseudintermedius]ASQ50970.1 cytochrome D ubiquinol oxidase subunit II [Staphylococcus pseudintermedius]EGQ0291191.1 cytochrome d ubiquinol oxidase subunit II [Staphylococcus pseudintermedius]EGQ0294686.1 cytochrome d ubiquinol oxidase subunit II [Staphylococc